MMLRAVFVSLVLFGVSFELEAGDWKPLVGDSLSGWTVVGGQVDAWIVEDGVLRCNGKGRGWLSTKDEYDNFELDLEFMIEPGGNSGVFLRTPQDGGDPTHHGMEIQILDNDAKKHQNLKAYQYSGSLYGVLGANPRIKSVPGSWHKLHIVCNGPKLEVSLDGHSVVSTNLNEHPKEEADVRGLTRKTGHIGLQNYGNPLQFRNVRIRKL